MLEHLNDLKQSVGGTIQKAVVREVWQHQILGDQRPVDHWPMIHSACRAGVPLGVGKTDAVVDVDEGKDWILGDQRLEHRLISSACQADVPWGVGETDADVDVDEGKDWTLGD